MAKGKNAQKGKSGKNQEEQTARKEEGEIREQEDERLEEYGQATLDRNRGSRRIHLITIIGEVEGHENLSGSSKTTKYDHILPQLAQIEDDERVEGLLVLLNTSGGDVDAGLAIAEMIASLSIPTVSLVLGGGHSIGVPLAVSARVSMIVPSASMTVHPVRMNGTVIAAPQTFHYFERIQERIIHFVEHNSPVEKETFRRLMRRTDELAADIGSILYGQEAVQLGLIDRIGGLSDALDCLHAMIAQQKKQKQ